MKPPEVKGPFEAAVSFEPRAEGKKLVDAYNSTYGASGPGCCPQALAAALKQLNPELISLTIQQLGG